MEPLGLFIIHGALFVPRYLEMSTAVERIHRLDRVHVFCLAPRRIRRHSLLHPAQQDVASVQSARVPPQRCAAVVLVGVQVLPDRADRYLPRRQLLHPRSNVQLLHAVFVWPSCGAVGGQALSHHAPNPSVHDHYRSLRSLRGNATMRCAI